MKFVNRTEERNFMREIVNEIMAEKETCVWIEGSRGSGKSYFIKYIKENSELPMFYYEGHNWVYKCNESGIENEYQFFIEVISSFQLEYPKKFNNFLTKYFENIYDVSWIETLAYILPNIKFTEWAKDLINKPLEQIESAKNEISNRLYNTGLRSCLAKLVIYILTETKKGKNVVFCIDDACWLDQHSICTLKMLLNMAKYEKYNELKISLIILTRPIKELNSGKENYNLLETVLKDVYDDIKYIRIKNFNYKSTQEYIELMDKKYVREITHRIFRVTNGNPQELFQALKFNDYDLSKIIQFETNVTYNNIFSSELIIKLASENTYVLPIICTISLMQQKMKLIWLATITRRFCYKVLNEEFNTIKYDKCIRILQEQNIIRINMNTIEIVHDSLKETAIEYIKNSGEYYDYMNCLTDTIKDEFEQNDDLLKELMYLYSEFSPTKCFDMFTRYCWEDVHFSEGSVIKLIAQSLIKDNSLFILDNIIYYIVPIILEKCIQFSYYDLGYTISSIIYYMQNDLPFDTRYRYLICFAKILIDKGMLLRGEQFNALDVIDNVIALPQLDSEQKIESYLIAMSAYEHILDFENIKKYNTLAKQIIDNEHIRPLYHAMYFRNQGLVKSHCILEQQYIQAIKYSMQIEKDYESKLMLGTCYNNLGLHYLYSSDIEKALQSFECSQSYLNEIGYDVFRVLNNVAICYMLTGNEEKAYDYLLQAKSLNINCIFEKLCIQSNISIVEYKRGKCDIAKEIVSCVIDDYQKTARQTADSLVYSSAMVNMAYFYFLESDYINSLKLYNDSMFFDYRYNDDLQKKKRKEMLNLCMYHLGIGDIPLHSIDTEDKDTNIFNKMYAPIAFAYYII